jgi:hypothetical protein
MKISSRQDICLPAVEVFAALCDFGHFEQWARQRGAVVTRMTEPPLCRVGSRWRTQFDFRAKPRELDIEVVELSPNEALMLDLSSRNLRGSLSCEIVPLSGSKTRLIVGVDVRPRTISARVWLQSLKLVKSKINDRFRARLEKFAAQIETRGRV